MLRGVMLRRSAISLFFIAILTAANLLLAQQGSPTASRSLANDAKYASDRILVKFRATTGINAKAAVHSLAGTHTLKQFAAVRNLEVVGLPAGLSVRDAVHTYRQRPEVEYAEPDYIVRALETPDDTYFPQLWNLLNIGQSGGTVGADIGATTAWNLSTGSREVIVAILDTGIDYYHADLTANLFHNTAVCNGRNDNRNGCYGIDPAYNDLDPFDDNGHGTHVAGTIGAMGNNSLGVVGVNWNVQLLACKFLDVNGSGLTSAAIDCLEYVQSMKGKGYNIVATNNSWGGGPHSQALADAILAQEQAGILFIVAAGNEFSNNDQTPSYPSNTTLPNVISVAATTRTDALAAFSNVGPHSVHLGAPGQEIISTLPGNAYGIESGTSMATPHVTGASALLAAQNPNLDWRGLKNLILAGGDARSSLSETITGKRLNIHGSMTCSGKTVSTRLQPVNDAIAASIGKPVTLEMLNIDCSHPNGNLQVTVSPGGQTLTLVDDGSGGDQAAGDGIYTAQWTPSSAGGYSLTFPAGDVVIVAVLNNYLASPTSFNYIAISGTNLNLGDDNVAQIASPFPIPFGGGSFTTLEIGSNGTISFTDAFSAFNNVGIPTSAPTPATLVAPFWGDLYPVTGSAQNVYWAVTGSAPNRELVVEWRNVRSFPCRSDASATITFQVVFSESSSNVLFQYLDTGFGGQCDWQDHGGDATVGVQVAPTVGTMWTADQQTIGDGTALLWTIESTPPTRNPVPKLVSLSPSTVTLGGPAFTLTANGSNFVPSSVLQWNGLDRVTTYVNNTKLTAQISAKDIAPEVAPSVYIDVSNPTPGGGESAILTYTFTTETPTITSISPSSATAGSFSFGLIVNGSGFAASQTAVYWNGTLLQGALVYSPTLLIVPVYFPNLATPGTAQVTVTNAPPGGGTSNPVTFTILAPTPGGLYQQQTAFLGGRWNPSDLVPSTPPVRFLGWKYAQRAGSSYLKTFLRAKNQSPPNPALFQALGNGSGTPNPLGIPPGGLAGLGLRPLQPAGFIPTAVGTGDFNGDGNPDWAVANGGSNSLWIYLGRGDGTFSQASVVALKGQSPVALAVADLRGNGKSDLIIAEADSVSVGVLLGNGDGTFALEQTYFVPGVPTCLAVADFDHDGHLDIVAGIIPNPESGPLVALRGDGAGKFGAPMFEPDIYGDETNPESIAVADFEKNGRPDIVMVDPNFGAVVYLNNGSGLFKRSQTVFFGFPGGGLAAVTAAAGDVNEDGCPDVAVLDSYGTARVFLGNCDGTFQDQFTQSGEGDTGWAVSLADMNGDGHLDLVYAGIGGGGTGGYGQNAGNLIGVLYGDGSGNFGNARVYRGGQSSYSLAIADFNRDGHPDIVAANQDSDSLTILLNDGHGGFGTPVGEYIGYINGNNSSGPVNSPYTSFTPSDLNGDGKPDLVIMELGPGYPNPYQATVLLNDGTGKFGPAVKSEIAEGTFVIGDYAVADFRNTGHPDLLAIGSIFNGSNAFLSFAPGDGTGKFGKPTVTSVPDALGILAVCDFNHDGKLDFVTAQPTGSTSVRLVVFLGRGDGTFTPQPAVVFNTNSLGHWPQALWIGDFNHDGKVDVLVWLYVNVVPYQNNDVYELLGNGDGTFGTARLVLQNLSGFSVADVNHDGLPDIVESRDPQSDYPTEVTPEFRIFLCQPDGSFVLTNTYAPYTGLTALPATGGGTPNGGRYTPWTGDFNGDGNIDVAAFQIAPGYFPPKYYVQFLLGNGDGAFTPTYEVFPFNSSTPNIAYDFNGDGRTDMVELDGFTSSFHVIPAEPGSTLHLHLGSNPVIGNEGSVIISLATPASSGTHVTLVASDPAIVVPASVAVPTGNLTQNVSFQIGGAFKSSNVFSIQGALGSSTAVAYGTQATSAGQYGVAIYTNNSSESAQPGQTTSNYQLGLNSLAGYSATLSLECQGLPAGAACEFGSNPVSVPAGGDVATSLVVSTSTSTPLGSYNFTIVATDGAVTAIATATLNLGDYSISISPSTTTVLQAASVSYTVNLSVVQGYSANLSGSCSGIPAPAVCSFPSAVTVGGNPLTIQTNSLAAGTYNFTVAVTNGTSSRSASAQLKIVGFDATLSTTVATISVGQSSSVTIDVTGQNGFTDPVNLRCDGAPAGATCAITPSSVIPSSTGTPATMTITVGSRPAAKLPAQPAKGKSATPMSWLGMSSITLGMVLLVSFSSGTHRKVVAKTLLLTILGIAISCGGGSTSGGGGGGGGGGGTTFSVTVQASADTVTKDIGTVRVTVP